MGWQPELIQSYLGYKKIVDDSNETSILDLSDCKWLYPTLLLPLFLHNKPMRPPSDNNARRYFETMVRNDHALQCCSTYLPLASFPKDFRMSDPILSKLYSLAGDIGKTSNFKNTLGELLDNVYQHSNFSFAAAAAQRYNKLGFTEICMVDNGMTIGGSLRNVGYEFDDTEAIIKAIDEGISSKKILERGEGLGSSIRYFIESQQGEAMIVSGSGGVYMSSDGIGSFARINMSEKFPGTLISARIIL